MEMNLKQLRLIESIVFPDKEVSTIQAAPNSVKITITEDRQFVVVQKIDLKATIIVTRYVPISNVRSFDVLQIENDKPAEQSEPDQGTISGDIEAGRVKKRSKIDTF